MKANGFPQHSLAYLLAVRLGHFRRYREKYLLTPDWTAVLPDMKDLLGLRALRYGSRPNTPPLVPVSNVRPPRAGTLV